MAGRALVLACFAALVVATASAHFSLLDHLEHHEVVRPDRVEVNSWPELTKQEIHLASFGHPEEELRHPSHVQFRFKAYDADFHLILRKNHLLFSPSYQEVRLGANSEVVSRKTRRDVPNCHYLGHVFGQPGSWVAVSTCNGMRGVINAFGHQFAIEPLDRQRRFQELGVFDGEQLYSVTGSDHMVYRTSSLKYPGEFHCGLDDEENRSTSNRVAEKLQEVHAAVEEQKAHSHHHSVHSDPLAHLHAHEFPRSTAADSSRTPINVHGNSHPHFSLQAGEIFFPEALAVNDLSRFQDFGVETEQNTGVLFNIVVGIYRNSTAITPNVIQPLLVKQITFTATEELPLPVTNGEIVTRDLLDDWADYRSVLSNVDNTPHDNGVLVSGRNFGGSTVGLAFVGAMCFTSLSASVNQATFSDAFNAATIAHEMGHNIGMCHDPPATRDAGVCPSLGAGLDATTCASRVMSASSSPSNPNNRFSACSNSDFNTYVTSSSYTANGVNGLDSFCMAEPAVIRSFENNTVCGNGFVENGEQCDCNFNAHGGSCASAPAPFTDPCCDGSTCQLLNSAVCSVSQRCCNTDCTIRDEGFVCRAAVDSCDIAETCDGVSGSCPADATRPPSECEDQGFAEQALSFIEENWFEIAVGVGGVIGLLILYKCAKECYQCCGCGEGKDQKDKERRQFRRQHTMARLQRARKDRLRQQHQAALRNQQNIQMQQQQQAQMQRQQQAYQQAQVQAYRQAQAQHQQQQQQQQQQQLQQQRAAAIANANAIQLPPGWVVQMNDKGLPVYFNTRTGEVYDFSKQ